MSAKVMTDAGCKKVCLLQLGIAVLSCRKQEHYKLFGWVSGYFFLFHWFTPLLISLQKRGVRNTEIVVLEVLEI